MNKLKYHKLRKMAEDHGIEIVAGNWGSYQVFLKNGHEETAERNPIFNQRVQNIKMKINLPRLDSSAEYQFKDIIGRDVDDFSEKSLSEGLRNKDKTIAEETKACIVATFMCIVVDEQFRKDEDVSNKVYHWIGAGETKEESYLRDQKLWEKYHWQSKIQNGEAKDLPQQKCLKEYILKIIFKSEGINFQDKLFVQKTNNHFVVSEVNQLENQ